MNKRHKDVLSVVNGPKGPFFLPTKAVLERELVEEGKLCDLPIFLL